MFLFQIESIPITKVIQYDAMYTVIIRENYLLAGSAWSETTFVEQATMSEIFAARTARPPGIRLPGQNGVPCVIQGT